MTEEVWTEDEADREPEFTTEWAADWYETLPKCDRCGARDFACNLMLDSVGEGRLCGRCVRDEEEIL
jgi:hypothetical protein